MFNSLEGGQKEAARCSNRHLGGELELFEGLVLQTNLYE